MRCKKCGGEGKVIGKVINSRPNNKGLTRRRIKCLNCDNRWTTYEIDEAEFIKMQNVQTNYSLLMQLIADFVNEKTYRHNE